MKAFMKNITLIFYVISVLLVISLLFSFINMQIGEHAIKNNNDGFLPKEGIKCIEVEIKCITKENNYIIHNQTEYNDLLNKKFGHPLCENVQLPVVDFNIYDLLGVVTSIEGIKPHIETNLVYDMNTNTYYHNSNVITYGKFVKNNILSHWCLIPKLIDDQIVQFNKNDCKRSIEELE